MVNWGLMLLIATGRLQLPLGGYGEDLGKGGFSEGKRLVDVS